MVTKGEKVKVKGLETMVIQVKVQTYEKRHSQSWWTLKIVKKSGKNEGQRFKGKSVADWTLSQATLLQFLWVKSQEGNKSQKLSWLIMV